MYKIFSFSALVVLCSNLLFPQAVDIPLIISDDMNNTRTVYFGLDPTATNGIDPHLGESDLPPFPPVGVFDVRFSLGSGLSSLRDYRHAILPFSGPVQHIVIWQLGSGASYWIINYNLPDYVSIPFGDSVLTDSGTIVIPGSITSIFIYAIYLNALPVELISFAGIQVGSAITLNWTTASETNNKGFELSRKIQNGDWEIISFIEGYGNTTEMQAYSYIDDFSNNIITGQIFYRLKQIDFDGTFEYSDVLKIDAEFNPHNYSLDQNYPNPFNPSTTINYFIPENSDVTLKIFDVLGNEIETLVDEVKSAGAYEINWTAADIPSGVYFYQLMTGNYTETKKMLLSK